MVKKLLISILVLLAIGVAATGSARAQGTERTLRGIPSGWSVTADGQSVTVNNNTAIITDGSEVILTPTTAEINFVKGVTLTDAPMPVIGNFILLDTLTRDYVMQDNDTLTGTLAGNYKISVAENATVTLYNVTINGAHDNNCKWAGITCLGDATINLIGTNIVRGFWAAYPAIQVGPDGTTLTIQGEGSLDAICNVFFYDYGSDYGSAAGIGSYYGGQSIVCGNIVILSGNIISKGGRGCPGIGSSKGTTCGDITISGGNVTAIGGASSAAIGCGEYFPSPASCGNILINGGTVMAIDTLGVGIGVGADEDNTYLGHNHCGTITITDDVTQVTAIGLWYPIGKYSNHDNSYLGAITIGGTVYWTGSAYSSYEHYQYIIQDTIVYPVQDLYIHYDNGTWPAGIESSHFTSNGDLKIACEPSYSISMIKNRIAKQTGFAESVMMLSYTGNVILADNQTLADYNIQKGSVITLTYEDSTIPVKQANGAWKFTMPDYNAQVDVEYYNGYVLTLACNGGGTVEFSGGILPQGVTAIPGGTANTYFVISGTVVTITATANENYYFKNWTDENNNVFGNSYTLTLTLTITGDTTLTANFIRDFEGSGTEDDPYLIPDIAKWRLLSYRVQKGNTYSGKYFKQTDSICVDTYSVGTYVNNDESLCSTFAGTYDGDGHALEIRYINTPYNNKAPFVYVDGATIKNVHTTGSIKTDQQFASGLVARTKTNDRTTTIINCRVSVSIQSTVSSNYKDCTHGGLVAVTNSKTNLIGCIFDGALIGAHSYRNGGFIGWADQNASVNFIDCIFAPDSVSMLENQSCTFSRARKDTSLHFTNSYYARSYGAEQGKKLRSITAGTDVTALGLAGAATVYNVSGITAYAGNNGLKYSDMFFAGDTDVVNLTLGHTDRTAESLVFSAYSASNGGTFSGDTLTMPNDSTIVSANYIQNLLMLTLNSDGNGTVGFSGGILPQGVTAVPGSTANTYYVVSGTEVTVKARANENYGIVNWTNENSNVMGTDSTLTITITGDTTLTANFVRDFEGSGTENDPYLIPNTEKWTLLSNRVKEGKGYYGKYFLQTDSIFAGRVYVGAYSHRPFGGIYDGGGHVLEFLDVTLSNKNRAPFICVDGATIQNLHVMGTIKTNNQFVSGLIARVVVNDKTTTIINCRSSIRIESVKTKDFDGTHGGFVAVTDAAVNFIGCVFDGALIGAKTRSSGGFIGWTEKNASVNFIDCIFAPDSLSMGDSLSCTFSRTRRDTSLHITNSYYAQAFGKEQGKKLRSITASADVTTLGLAGTATVYNVSGITAYAGNNGLKYGDMFFAGDTDVVNLTLGHADRSAEGMIFDSYSASNGASFNGDTLTMANDSTVVSANYIQNLMLTLNSDGNGTVGFCGDTLPQGVTPGSTANTYYVVSGTEVCIKATPAEHNYMQKWNNEAALNSNEAVNTSFTVTKDTTLTAYFVQKPILTLGTNPSNPVRGTVTIAGNSLPNYVAQIGTSNSYYVDYDSSVTVVATPIEHYHLASWSNTGGNDQQQVVTMTQDMEVTGVFAIDTFTLTLQTNDINKGSVAVTNHNGNPAIVSHDPDANGTRTYKVNYGTEVIIKATPKEHYHLDSWSNGVTVNTDDTIHVIVTTDSTIMATFDTNTYVLNVVSADAAMGSVSGSNPAAKHFLSYEISATANNGCHFVQWNDGNTDNPRTVTLSSDSTFTATFAANPAELAWSTNTFTGYTYIDFNNYKPTLTNPHNVSVRYGCAEGPRSQQGGILCDAQTGTIGASSSVYGYIHGVAGTYHIYAVHETDQTYYYDSVVYTLHVLPSAQVSLTKNIADGGVVSMPDYTDESTLTHLYITVNGTSYAYVAQGYSMNIMAEPATGYHFSKWTLDQSDLSTNAAYTYQAPATITGNLLLQYIQAVFDTNTYALNVLSADAEMGSVSGSNPEAKHFISYEISAIPGPDYRFERWNDGNTNNPRTVTLTSDSNFTAYFAPNSYTITYMDGQTELNVDTFDYRQPIREYTTSKQGWNFEGWNPEVPQLMPAENLVVYAQWSRICEPVTDVDHNTYPTVGIGSICWMAENLRTTHYADGREITNIYEYHCKQYPNVQENVSVYGRLYDWYDATDSARPTRATRVQGICPDGWYLPNEEDFELLNSVNLQTLRSTNYWLFNPGTNSTGYDLRPSGMYNFGTGRYENLRGEAYLWSVTSTSDVEAHCHMADCNCYMLVDLIYHKQNALSVRCVKD